LQPRNLADPLVWLATALQALDETRMEQLWTLVGGHVALWERCVRCFERRYPEAPATRVYRQRLRELKHRLRRRRGMVAAAVAACLALSLWTYDAFGYRQATRFEEEHKDDPTAQLEHWQSYQTWHPTRHVFASLSAEEEQQRLDDLARSARERERDGRLADLRRRAGDPDAEPDVVWRQFQEFRAGYPELNIAGDLEQLRAAVKARRDEQVRKQTQRAYDDLARATQRSTDLTGLLALSDRFLRDYPGSAQEGDAQRLRAAALSRLDEQDIQGARDYSARQPFNFQTRREMYQRYLDRHPEGGAFVDEAKAAMRTIDDAWDKHDFRRVRDRFVASPGDIGELVNLCRRYLAVHPKGKFTGAAAELLRWSERVTAPGEYQVKVRDGQFEKSVARWLSRGPKLSVEVEVNGIRYGPSTIIYNRYDPTWNFEFPRPIRWKLGDPVVIRVTEHSWKNRIVAEMHSAGNDPLALRMLAGDAYSGGNRVTFESSFAMPRLPKIE
jgi:hypothetical protein